ASVQATNSTSGVVRIQQAEAPAQPLTTVGTGVRNMFPSGTVILSNLGDTVTVAAGAAVLSGNGAITVTGVDLNIAGPINSGTARTTLASSHPTQSINIGSNPAGSMGLTQAELNN